MTTAAGSSAPRFAVLKTGTANRLARERLGDFSGMFLTLLQQPGQTWDVIDVQHGQFPEDIGRYAGFAITGSRASAYDSAPWIHRLLELIREIHARQVPLLGMCFGHQAIGLALGGAVEPNLKGWDVGARTIELTAPGRALPLLAAAPAPLRIHKLHQDVVTRLPPGATHLARSEHVEYEAFAVGDAVLCLQGHAEFDDDVIREALEKLEGASVVNAEKAAASRASLAVPTSHAFWQPRLQAFFAQGGLRAAAAVPLTPAARR